MPWSIRTESNRRPHMPNKPTAPDQSPLFHLLFCFYILSPYSLEVFYGFEGGSDTKIPSTPYFLHVLKFSWDAKCFLCCGVALDEWISKSVCNWKFAFFASVSVWLSCFFSECIFPSSIKLFGSKRAQFFLKIKFILFLALALYIALMFTVNLN